ncbi:MAG TPA: flagellar hook-associated protein FlgL [Sedimentisphaerales bacterium]|nr:flagellar hook-associated protein FlgL [Sedimentisphaerales bacterium]
MGQTLGSIYNNVSFALNLHAEQMARLQEQAATGARINRPSDDPSTAYLVLGLSSQQRSLGNYMDNVSDLIGAFEISSTIIGNMVSGLAEAKTSLTQIINGIYGEDGRERIAEGINSILEQMALLANTEHNNQYLFGGSNTTSAPYLIERSGGEITSVTYQGSLENRTTEVAPGVNSTAFTIGDSIFSSHDRSEPLFTGDTGAQAGTGTSTVTGDVWLTVIHDGSNYKLSIDDGASYVTVPAGGDANQAVTDSRTGKVLYVDSTAIGATGTELVRVTGTYNIFDTLISIRDMLRNEKGFSKGQLQEMLGESLNSLDEVSNILVQAEVSVGYKVGFLNDLTESMQNVKYNAEDESTRLQQADIAQVAIDLSRREVLYQMSLSITAKLMSLSLLNFLT